MYPYVKRRPIFTQTQSSSKKIPRYTNMFADTPVIKKRKTTEMLKDHPGGMRALTSEAAVAPKQKRKKPSSRRSTLNRNLETDDLSYRDEPTMSSSGQMQLSMLETPVKPKRPQIQKLAFTKTMSEDAEARTIIPVTEEITPDGLYEAFVIQMEVNEKDADELWEKRERPLLVTVYGCRHLCAFKQRKHILDDKISRHI